MIALAFFANCLCLVVLFGEDVLMKMRIIVQCTDPHHHTKHQQSEHVSREFICTLMCTLL
jgi:hypothetical protein